MKAKHTHFCDEGKAGQSCWDDARYPSGVNCPGEQHYQHSGPAKEALDIQCLNSC